MEVDHGRGVAANTPDPENGSRPLRRTGPVLRLVGAHSERDGRPGPAAPFIPPVWYRARPWDPPITNDAACL